MTMKSSTRCTVPSFRALCFNVSDAFTRVPLDGTDLESVYPTQLLTTTVTQQHTQLVLYLCLGADSPHSLPSPMIFNRWSLVNGVEDAPLQRSTAPIQPGLCSASNPPCSLIDGGDDEWLLLFIGPKCPTLIKLCLSHNDFC